MFSRHLPRCISLAAAFTAVLSGALVARSARAESTSVAARLDANPAALTDGTHLYGSTSQPQQIGETYMVFEAQGDRVVGGFYQPSSSFDCFYGNLNGDRLALTVVNSYSQDRYPFALAVSRDSQVAGRSGSSANVEIPGFQSLNELGEVDRHILSTCQAVR